MAAHKGPASLRPRCTRSGSSVDAIPDYQSLLHPSLTTCDNPVQKIITLTVVAVGLWLTALLLGTKKDTLRLLFLEPEDIRNVSLGAIWSFGKVTGLS
jgi:hypothetical protein